jgi:hypothetical protein
MILVRLLIDLDINLIMEDYIMKKNRRVIVEATINVPKENTFSEMCGVMSDILYRLDLDDIRVNCTELTKISTGATERHMIMRIYSNAKIKKHEKEYATIIMEKVFKKLADMFNTYIITANQKGVE